jgi:WD40 repeat protein
VTPPPAASLAVTADTATPLASAPPQPATALPATAAPSNTMPPTVTAVPTAAATQPPTATTPPPIPAIAPENLAQMRLRWSANFPGDVEHGLGCDPKSTHCARPTNLTSYAFSPDGATLAAGVCSGVLNLDQTQPNRDNWTCDGEAAIRLYDSATGVERAPLLPAAMPLSLAFQPGATILAAGLGNSTIELWDIASGERAATLDAAPKFVGLNHLAYTPDGSLLVSGGGLQLQVWDGHSGQLLSTLPRSAGLGLSAAGDRLVTLSLPQGRGAYTIRLYDLPQAGHFTELAPDPQGPVPTYFTFNPKNGWLATVDNANSAWVQFWDLTSGAVAARLDFTQDYNSVGVLYGKLGIFTPGGYYLLIREGKLKAPEAQPAVTGLTDSLYGCGFALLDLEAGRTFFGPPMPYETCTAPPYDYEMEISAFNVLSPDGRFIAEGDTFGYFRVWGIDPAAPAAPPLCSGNCPSP